MDAADLYHAGVVVEDFEGARTALTAAGGHRWTETAISEVAVQLPDGERTVRFKVCFSTTRPHLELIEAIPGTVWEPPSSGVHHVGYWSDDVVADCAALEAGGMDVEAWAELGGIRMFAYCKAGDGPRIELVHRSFQPVLAGWVADVAGA
jgi:hypothetical protein